MVLYARLRTSAAIGDGTTAPSTWLLPGVPSRSMEVIFISHDAFFDLATYVTSMPPRKVKTSVPSFCHIHSEMIGISESCSLPSAPRVKGVGPTMRWFHIDRNS